MAIILDETTWLESTKNKLYGIEIEKIESDDEITLEMLEECLQTSAEIVKLHGKKYLPIFERMHHEVENWKKNEVMLEKALNLADSNDRQI